MGDCLIGMLEETLDGRSIYRSQGSVGRSLQGVVVGYDSSSTGGHVQKAIEQALVWLLPLLEKDVVWSGGARPTVSVSHSSSDPRPIFSDPRPISFVGPIPVVTKVVEGSWRVAVAEHSVVGGTVSRSSRFDPT